MFDGTGGARLLRFGWLVVFVKHLFRAHSFSREMVMVLSLRLLALLLVLPGQSCGRLICLFACAFAVEGDGAGAGAEADAASAGAGWIIVY